jgi:hypothetical protein
MNTFIQITKELFQMSIALIIVGTVAKLFLAHTLIGKIIAVTFKNIYLTLRGLLSIMNCICKKMYDIGKTTNNYLNKKNKTKQIKKKVVNGENLDNIIDLKTAKKLRHKW